MATAKGRAAKGSQEIDQDEIEALFAQAAAATSADTGGEQEASAGSGLGETEPPVGEGVLGVVPLAGSWDAALGAPEVDLDMPGPGGPASVSPVQFAPLRAEPAAAGAAGIDLLLDVSLQVTAELGRTELDIREILALGPGSVIELERLAGEPVDILVNGTLIARGEVVVVDEKFGVRVTEVVPPAKRVMSLG